MDGAKGCGSGAASLARPGCSFGKADALPKRGREVQWPPKAANPPTAPASTSAARLKRAPGWQAKRCQPTTLTNHSLRLGRSPTPSISGASGEWCPRARHDRCAAIKHRKRWHTFFRHEDTDKGSGHFQSPNPWGERTGAIQPPERTRIQFLPSFTMFRVVSKLRRKLIKLSRFPDARMVHKLRNGARLLSAFLSRIPEIWIFLASPGKSAHSPGDETRGQEVPAQFPFPACDHQRCRLPLRQFVSCHCSYLSWLSCLSYFCI